MCRRDRNMPAPLRGRRRWSGGHFESCLGLRPPLSRRPSLGPRPGRRVVSFRPRTRDPRSPDSDSPARDKSEGPATLESRPAGSIHLREEAACRRHGNAAPRAAELPSGLQPLTRASCTAWLGFGSELGGFGTPGL